jgi:undecaprenyl-diphosphatase
MNGDQGLFVPLLLGIIEGLTEFLPVSSTAHLLLIGHLLGFDSPGRVFEVMIQLGAILAIVTVYSRQIWILLRDAINGKPYAWRFALGVALASFPAALVGVIAHDFIKTVIYESPELICSMLIIGGVILLFVDQMRFKPRYTDIYSFPPYLCFVIGLIQMLALIPGVSRSGATIVGSLLMGTDKRSAAEFSFFIAMPLMLGAFGYDFWANRELITVEMGWGILVGLIAAFVVGALVVRYLLDFVSKSGFAFFAYWRIFVGAIGLWAVILFR